MSRLAWALAAAGWAMAAAALAAASRARHAAETDPLTGLPNRRGLARAWQQARGHATLHFLDLSGFRAVNDAHGHAVGDRVLAEVARRLAAALPAGAVLARHGGDEFVVIAPAGRDPAPALAATLAAPILLPGGGSVTLGLWLGAAPAGTGSLEAALGAALADMRRRRLAASAPVQAA